MFTDFPDEEEVLLPPGSMFEVLQNLSGALLGGVRCITLKQAWGWHHLDAGFTHAASASERLVARDAQLRAAAERCDEQVAESANRLSAVKKSKCAPSTFAATCLANQLRVHQSTRGLD